MNIEKFAAKLTGDFFRPGWNRYRPEGVKEIAGLVYDEIRPRDCRLDMYRKTLSGMLPVFLYVHGGVCAGLGRQHRKGICRLIASQGFAVLCPDYGMGVLPDKLGELLSVLEWARANGRKHGLDPSRFYLGGDGSGAFIAAGLCCALTNPDYPVPSRLDPSQFSVSGAAFFCGIYDLAAELNKKVRFGFQRPLAKEIAGINLKYSADIKNAPFYETLKPLEYISSAFPPVFFSQTAADIYCPGQGDLLKKKLNALGVPYWEMCAVESPSPHIWNLDEGTEEARACNAALADFLAKDKKDIANKRFEI